MFERLRTIVYSAQNLPAARDWYTLVLGQEPYFSEPFYVGFNVNGSELGLDPNAPAAGQAGPITYWRVANADEALARLRELGATRHQPVQDVGGGIRLGTVVDPFGNVVGVISEPGPEGA